MSASRDRTPASRGPTPPARETVGDRLVSAAFGGAIGAGFGFLLALLLAGASAWIRVGTFHPSFAAWTIGGGVLFALGGLVLGSRASEILGSAIGAVLNAEAFAYTWWWSFRWFFAVLVLGIVGAVLRGVFA